ncbi:hypothetical protein [Mycolicibacterium sp. XJ1819]
MTTPPGGPDAQWRRPQNDPRSAEQAPVYPPPPRSPYQHPAAPNGPGYGYGGPPPSSQPGPPYGTQPPPPASYPGYPPAPMYLAPGVAPEPRSRIGRLLDRKGAKAVAGGMATVLVAMLGVIGTYVLAPSQEVASQEAVAQHQRDEDARTAPVLVEDVWGTSSPDGQANLISPDVVDLDSRALHESEGDPYGSAQVLPSAFPTGSVLFTSSGEFRSGSKSSIGFTLTGQQNATVRIRDIHAVITERKPAFKGTMIFFPPQGNLPNLQMGFDLDSEDLSARVLDDRENVTDKHYFRENTVSLQRGEPIGFNTIATTTECACKFTLVVEFSDGRTTEIGSAGQPFELAPYRDDAQRIYAPVGAPGGDGDWVLKRCPSMAACAQIAYR